MANIRYGVVLLSPAGDINSEWTSRGSGSEKVGLAFSPVVELRQCRVSLVPNLPVVSGLLLQPQVRIF